MPEPVAEFQGWFMFWINLLYVALAMFSVVAVVVTVKGWQEIRTMLSRLQESGDEHDGSEE